MRWDHVQKRQLHLSCLRPGQLEPDSGKATKALPGESGEAWNPMEPQEMAMFVTSEHEHFFGVHVAVGMVWMLRGWLDVVHIKLDGQGILQSRVRCAMWFHSLMVHNRCGKTSEPGISIAIFWILTILTLTSFQALSTWCCPPRIWQVNTLIVSLTDCTKEWMTKQFLIQPGIFPEFRRIFRN